MRGLYPIAMVKSIIIGVRKVISKHHNKRANMVPAMEKGEKRA